jgi:hypothetical protein
MTEKHPYIDADVLNRAAITGNQADPEVQVAVTFDWQPVVTDGRARFHLSLARGSERSELTFEIHLDVLTEPELERLHLFLVRRQLGMTTHQEMAAAICWLIDCSLRQSEPLLGLAERTSRLRVLLLLPDKSP